MKFIRQFEVRKAVKKNTSKNKKSATVQGAVLSNQTIVNKYLQGNMYGISLNSNICYDSDLPDFNPDSVIHLDRSDKLISMNQLKNRKIYLDQKKQKYISDFADQQQATPVTDVAK